MFKLLQINRLPQALSFTRSRCLSSAPTCTFEQLKKREILRIKGEEVVPFLQGLVTNDVSLLEMPNGPAAMYAFFLNKAGRVLYDTIIYRTKDPKMYLLECDKEATNDLQHHLRTYRVRRKIDIGSANDDYVPYVVFNTQNGSKVSLSPRKQKLYAVRDPRLLTLGTRVLAEGDMTWKKVVESFVMNENLKATKESADNNYQLLRYKQGVGEGIDELAPGKYFPHEANGDFLNGISFQKGCYIGQELTARVQHSGVVRKRHMPLHVTPPIAENTIQTITGANVGSIVGHSGNHALALMRIEHALKADQKLSIRGQPCYAEKPNWWPDDLPMRKQRSLVE